MTIVATLKDGRTIASATATILPTTAGNYSITFTISELKTIDALLHITLNTEPLFDPGTPAKVDINGNVVGITLVGVAQGGTINGEAVVVGY